jgi:hypothetical protein
LIRLALVMEENLRSLREQDEELSEIERQAYARIADVLFGVQGSSTYPDATFTLRLAFGPVRGYEERGRQIAAWTTLGGAFDREQAAGAKPPWRLPESWRQEPRPIGSGDAIQLCLYRRHHRRQLGQSRRESRRRTGRRHLRRQHPIADRRFRLLRHPGPRRIRSRRRHV